MILSRQARDKTYEENDSKLNGVFASHIMYVQRAAESSGAPGRHKARL
jgi:hypothetical protein